MQQLHNPVFCPEVHAVAVVAGPYHALVEEAVVAASGDCLHEDAEGDLHRESVLARVPAVEVADDAEVRIKAFIRSR